MAPTAALNTASSAVSEAAPVSMATGSGRRLDAELGSLRRCRRSELDILYKIGRGSFGAVYKCHFGGRICALKQINESNNRVDPRWIRVRLEKEIKLLHGVGSESAAFVQVLAVCTDSIDRWCGYVMEYFHFGNLRSVLNRLKSFRLDSQNFPWLVLRLLLQVAQGLRYLQEERQEILVHKDVAVDNVFVNYKMEAKLGDFGLARSLSEPLGNNTIDFEDLVGIERRPPELLSDPLRLPDVYVDRFLFGVCLYEALTCSSLRQRVGDGVAEYREMLINGRHVDSLVQAADAGCFQVYPERLRDPADAFQRMRTDSLELLRGCLATAPEQRPPFSSVCEVLRSIVEDPQGCSSVARETELALTLLQPDPSEDEADSRQEEASAAAASLSVQPGGARQSHRIRTTDDNLESLRFPRGDSGMASTAATYYQHDFGHTKIGTVDGRTFDVGARQTTPNEQAEQPQTSQFARKPAPQQLLAAIFRSSLLRDAWPDVLRAMGAPEQQVHEAALAARSAKKEDQVAALETLGSLLPHPVTVRQLADGLIQAECRRALPLLGRLQGKYLSPVTSTESGTAR